MRIFPASISCIILAHSAYASSSGNGGNILPELKTAHFYAAVSLCNEGRRLILRKKAGFNYACNAVYGVLKRHRVNRIFPKTVCNLISVIRNYRSAFAYAFAKNNRSTKFFKRKFYRNVRFRDKFNRKGEFDESATMTNREELYATIFSRRSAAPPPFIRLLFTSISSAPSIARSR